MYEWLARLSTNQRLARLQFPSRGPGFGTPRPNFPGRRGLPPHLAGPAAAERPSQRWTDHREEVVRVVRMSTRVAALVVAAGLVTGGCASWADAPAGSMDPVRRLDRPPSTEESVAPASKSSAEDRA